jgi:L-lactate dehydrogenase complex protein LldF
MAEITTEKYKQAARAATSDRVLQSALADVQGRLGKGTAAAYRALPEGPDLRLRAHDIRMEAVAHLDILLEMLVDRIRRNGGQVCFAATADEAVTYCLEVAARNGVKRVVKGKSMVTEEIGLNAALTDAGIEVTETDLGEYIIQLAGEHPSHIIAPAIHKTREQVGRLFADKLGIEYTDDPPTLTQAARKALRQKFLTADMGTSGCNIACAETGHITTLSNEGNIRMSTTLPRVHMAFMGMERIVGRLADHDVLFRLLARGAAAQNMATYVSYIGGPRRSGQADGPEDFHLVILDNGRSRILADERFREMLCCIRCAACLNVCPVYGKIGGHAYGYPYSGPVGAVVTPLLVGVNRAKDLCLGETLCGACQDACPVNIDLPRMLLELRATLADGDPTWQVTPASRAEKAGFMAWSRLVASRPFYDLALKLEGLGQTALPRRAGRLTRLPPPFDGWTRSRDLKPLARQSFMQWWRETRDRR